MIYKFKPLQRVYHDENEEYGTIVVCTTGEVVDPDIETTEPWYGIVWDGWYEDSYRKELLERDYSQFNEEDPDFESLGFECESILVGV